MVLPPTTEGVPAARRLVRGLMSDSDTEADADPVVPRLHEFSVTAATWRGLRLLDSLALRWGVRPDPPQGKVVWFEVGPAMADTWERQGEDWLAEATCGDS